jgi:hypothetical protein
MGDKHINILFVCGNAPINVNPEGGRFGQRVGI